MNDLYYFKCSNCGEQPHRIKVVSRNKGVKLYCVLCQRETKKWINLKRLRIIELKGGIKNEQ